MTTGVAWTITYQSKALRWRIAMSTDSSSALRLQGFSPILQGELRMLYNLCLAMWRGMTTGVALTRISRRI